MFAIASSRYSPRPAARCCARWQQWPGRSGCGRTQGARIILTILLPCASTRSTAANAAGLEPGTQARAPTLQAWQSAPPRGRVRTAMSRRVCLGYTPLVRGLGRGHIANTVRQECSLVRMVRSPCGRRHNFKFPGLRLIVGASHAEERILRREAEPDPPRGLLPHGRQLHVLHDRVDVPVRPLERTVYIVGTNFSDH